VLQSRHHDVTELPLTSARRIADNAGEASTDNDQHHYQQQQQQQPTSTQYISDTCMILTYFTGDIESNVDEHFARALGRPSSFDPGSGTAVHVGSPTHSAAWLGRQVCDLMLCQLPLLANGQCNYD